MHLDIQPDSEFLSNCGIHFSPGHVMAEFWSPSTCHRASPVRVSGRFSGLSSPDGRHLTPQRDTCTSLVARWCPRVVLRQPASPAQGLPSLPAGSVHGGQRPLLSLAPLVPRAQHTLGSFGVPQYILEQLTSCSYSILLTWNLRLEGIMKHWS